MDKNKNLTLKNVVASLNYGKISSMKLYPVWIIGVVLGLGGFVLSFLLPFAGALAVTVLAAFTALITGYILVADIMIRAKLRKTLKDGVVVQAEAALSERKKNTDRVKIAVKFKDGKKKISKISETFDDAFLPYCGKEIAVVYSKKYDDMLIIR